MDQAPDFNDGYPSRGQIIGPAWQKLWELMADGEIRTHRSAYDELVDQGIVIHPMTVRTLLRQARKQNVIKGQVIGPRGTQRATYWRE